MSTLMVHIFSYDEELDGDGHGGDGDDADKKWIW